MATALRAEQADAGLEHALHAQILHAVVGACRRIETSAFEIGLKNYSSPVELKLMLVEDIIENLDKYLRAQGKFWNAEIDGSGL
jgi:hypothetical protein